MKIHVSSYWVNCCRFFLHWLIFSSREEKRGQQDACRCGFPHSGSPVFYTPGLAPNWTDKCCKTRGCRKPNMTYKAYIHRSGIFPTISLRISIEDDSRIYHLLVFSYFLALLLHPNFHWRNMSAKSPESRLLCLHCEASGWMKKIRSDFQMSEEGFRGLYISKKCDCVKIKREKKKERRRLASPQRLTGATKPGVVVVVVWRRNFLTNTPWRWRRRWLSISFSFFSVLVYSLTLNLLLAPVH